jgi:hypothetical protein
VESSVEVGFGTEVGFEVEDGVPLVALAVFLDFEDGVLFELMPARGQLAKKTSCGEFDYLSGRLYAREGWVK